MKPLFNAALAAVLALLTGAAHAGPCENLLAQIETKIKAKGGRNFMLSISPAKAKVEGKVVGNCESGAKKIVLSSL